MPQSNSGCSVGLSADYCWFEEWSSVSSASGWFETSGWTEAIHFRMLSNHTWMFQTLKLFHVLCQGLHIVDFNYLV